MCINKLIYTNNKCLIKLIKLFEVNFMSLNLVNKTLNYQVFYFLFLFFVSSAFLETVLETVRCLGVYRKVRERSSLPGVVARCVIAKGGNKHRKRFGFTQRPREPIAQRRAALRDPADGRSPKRSGGARSTKTGPSPARTDGPRASPPRTRRSAEPHLGGAGAALGDSFPRINFHFKK